MKTIYILLTRSGTLLSKLVYAATGASYTHASMAFDAELSCLYSSTRKNGYTMFPAGPSKEYRPFARWSGTRKARKIP